jgi:hypothetical protein
MKWDLPPKIKIYEALGSLGDNRIIITGNHGKVFSSSKNKFYDINYDPISNSVMSNDNASFFAGYLGYPAIAYLMAEEVVIYDRKWEETLKEIPWKDINQKFKNNYDKTLEFVFDVVTNRGYDIQELEDEVDNIYFQLKKLDLNQLGKKVRPPAGY